MESNNQSQTENEQRNEFEFNARITAITEPDPAKQRKLYKDLCKWIKAGRPLIQTNKDKQ